MTVGFENISDLNFAFFPRYQSVFGMLEGMFSFEAALMMAAYAQIAAEEDVRRDTLEIGVHHGLSAMLVAALRSDSGRFVAIDLFEDMQDKNVSHSGSGSKQRFLGNMAKLYGENLDFTRVIAAPSITLKPADLGRTYSFCHVDGGHSEEETYRDLVLCSRILLPNGILVLDDYFNSNYPGVSEGAIRFKRLHKGKLLPLAIGFNKVVFQKPARTSLFSRDRQNLNEKFAARFPQLPHSTAELWGQPVFHFGSRVSVHFDLMKSSPHELVLQESVSMQVDLRPKTAEISGRAGEMISVPVEVRNRSDLTLTFGEQPMGLSYHLKAQNGESISWDNKREFFFNPLAPGQERVMEVSILLPETAGQYSVEFDVVWEGVCWFQEKGNHTSEITLRVV